MPAARGPSQKADCASPLPRMRSRAPERPPASRAAQGKAGSELLNERVPRATHKAPLGTLGMVARPSAQWEDLRLQWHAQWLKIWMEPPYHLFAMRQAVCTHVPGSKRCCVALRKQVARGPGSYNKGARWEQETSEQVVGPRSTCAQSSCDIPREGNNPEAPKRQPGSKRRPGSKSAKSSRDVPRKVINREAPKRQPGSQSAKSSWDIGRRFAAIADTVVARGRRYSGARWSKCHKPS